MKIQIHLRPNSLTWLDAFHYDVFIASLANQLDKEVETITQDSWDGSYFGSDILHVVDLRLLPEDPVEAEVAIEKFREPIILLDGRDYMILRDGWGGAARTLLPHRNVRAIIKQGLADYTLQNKPMYEDSVIGDTVYHAAQPWQRPYLFPVSQSKHIHPDDFTYKCRVATLVAWGHHTQGVIRIVGGGFDFYNRKLIDVGYLATAGSYAQVWGVRHHRMLAYEAVRALRPEVVKCVGVYLDPNRNLIRTDGVKAPGGIEHTRMLRMSKMALLAWGWSENSMRDWEARVGGCVTITPTPPLPFKTNPNIYDHAGNFWCKPDFSDLPSIVDHVLNQWETLSPVLEEERKEFVAKVTGPIWGASIVADVLREYL